MDKEKEIAELAEKIETDVKNGFMTIGSATSAPLAEGHSAAWLIGALTSLEHTVDIIRNHINKFDGRDKYEAMVAEIIAKVSCVTDSYSYKTEVKSDD